MNELFKVLPEHSIEDTELQAADVIMIHHIANTGGNALYNTIVQSRSDFNPCLHMALHEDMALQVLAGSHAKSNENAAIVNGHCLFGAHEVFPVNIKYITILRDPKERFISEYCWTHRKSKLNKQTLIDKISTYVYEIDQANFLTYTLARFYFAGIGKFYTSDQIHFNPKNFKSLSIEDAFVKAQENLNKYIKFVAISELLEASLFLFFARMGWSNIAPWVRISPAPNRPRVDELPWHVRVRLDQLVEADQQIYDEQRIILEKEFQDALFDKNFKTYISYCLQHDVKNYPQRYPVLPVSNLGII